MTFSFYNGLLETEEVMGGACHVSGAWNSFGIVGIVWIPAKVHALSHGRNSRGNKLIHTSPQNDRGYMV